MTKPISAREQGLKPHYKIRLALNGALIHLASWKEPKVFTDQHDKIALVEADWISDPRYGDTLGHVVWEQVAAVTWRWSS
jgi:hypothetical protein